MLAVLQTCGHKREAMKARQYVSSGATSEQREKFVDVAEILEAVELMGMNDCGGRGRHRAHSAVGSIDNATRGELRYDRSTTRQRGMALVSR